ncbi:MAG: hypothetical protein PUE30_04180 [Spirochaetia bacterium]|uniref:hypothetical protein n=1 Tax=Treponema berlinense TaxID=225004 RepID=UPI0015B8A7F1|nr:hypothetical protein [Treponema berlinense]MDD5789703.1 hypothetical protein [Spirochaetia bacterium]
MTQTLDFDDWTGYDEWLIQNYDNYGITLVEETGGKIHVEFMDKSEWNEFSKKLEEAEEATETAPKMPEEQPASKALP